MTAIDPAEAEDLHCPVCDYSLRALPEPRCPECGYAFEWAELIEAARRKKLWFYEHAGTFKSHLITRWKSFWVFPFWREIHAYSAVNQQRRTLYFSVSMVLTFITALLAPVVIKGCILIESAMEIYAGPWPRPTPYVFNRPMQKPPFAAFAWLLFTKLMRESADALGQLVRFNPEGLLYEIAAAGTILIVVFGGPLYWKVLSRSMRLAGAKPFHLSRINVYVSDVLPVTIVMLAIVMQLQIHPAGRYSYYASSIWHGTGTFQAWLFFVFGTPAILFLPIAFRFGWALKKYLRFPHAAGVAAGYWIIAVLAWAFVINSVPQ